MSITKPADQRITRCAIYTRKSTEHGLDMAVSSLEAQRDVCQAYIKCQAHRNWVELPCEYDDGGYSGGSLERPALQRLIADVEAGRALDTRCCTVRCLSTGSNSDNSWASIERRLHCRISREQ